MKELWIKFWFDKQTSYALALFRIIYSLIVLDTLVNQIGVDLFRFYGPEAIVQHTDFIASCWYGQPRFDLQLLFGEQGGFTLAAIFSALVVACITLCLGLASRLSAGVVYLGLLSLHDRCQLWEDGGDDLMRIAAFFLFFSCCGAVLSIDNAIRKKVTGEAEERLYEPWAQRMLQIQMCIVYGMTWLSKMLGPDWLSGIAVYKATRYESLLRFPVPPFMDNPALYMLLTYMTLIIEFALFSLVWIKPVRYIVLLAGLSMHLGIEYCCNIPGFEYITVCYYLLFIQEKDVIGFVERLKRWLSSRLKFLRLPALLDAACTWFANQLPRSVKAALQRQTPIPKLVWCISALVVFCVPLLLCQNKIDLIDAQAKSNRYSDRMAQEKQMLEPQINSIADSKGSGTSDLLERYADVLWSLHIYDQARDSYLKALTAVPTTEYSQRIRIILRLASLNRDMDNCEESLRLYQQALELDEQHFPSNYPARARDLSNLGLAQYLLGISSNDKSRRLVLFSQSEKTLREALGAIPPGTLQSLRAACLNNLYYVLRDNGHKQEADQALREAQEADVSIGRSPVFSWYGL